MIDLCGDADRYAVSLQRWLMIGYQQYNFISFGQWKNL